MSGRLRGWLRAWPGDRREWVRVLLLFLALEVAVLSLERADWISPMPSLTPVLAIAMLLGWRLARRPLSGWLALLVALAAGVAVTLWLGGYLIPEATLTARFDGLLATLGSWAQAGGPGSNAIRITFGALLIALTWATGYIAAWLLTRRKNVWAGLAAGAVVLLVNLSNLPERYHWFFGAYLLAAALLVAWDRLAGRPYFSGKAGRGSRRVLASTGAALLCLLVLAGALAWAAPEPRLTGLRTAIAARTLWTRDIEESPLNVFASVPSKQPMNTDASLGEIGFGPLWHASEEIDFIVQSPRPSYWRVQVYDTYGNEGWSNRPVEDVVLEGGSAWADADSFEETMPYSVIANSKSNVLLMTGEFIAADIPVLVRASERDIAGIAIPRVLTPGERYSVIAGLVSPSPEELALVRAPAPQAIAAVYLQLPPDFPREISRLAGRLTRRAGTAYEKVRAIDSYLSTLAYSTSVEAPPEGVSSMEDFLFEQQSGFCLYFASAMAVMLRSVDVPARLAVGYLPGERGVNPGEYILRDNHYHAWVQAYFPGYGWVDLEATPAGSSSESQVAVETPWVSPGTIEQAPAWNPAQYLPPYGPPIVPPQAGQAAAPPPANAGLRGPLPFAATLGRILLLIVAGAILAAVVMLPFMALRNSFDRWLWHVDRRDLAATAYARMAALAGMVKMGPRPQQTPLEFAAELGAAFPQEAADAERIAGIYAGSRFGGKGEGLGLFEEAEVLKARCRVYSRLAGRLGWMKRMWGRRR